MVSCVYVRRFSEGKLEVSKRATNIDLVKQVIFYKLC
jgi:hypothetical protein